MQMRAAYAPVNQAWFILFGRKGAPLEKWSVISVGDTKVWPGKKNGRRMLKETLARHGLRFSDDDPNLIVTDDAWMRIEEEEDGKVWNT